MSRPNLVFICTDQQRWDATGIYGNDVIQTPNMDRLGREGVTFERAYCAHPVCMPTRATLLTGYDAYHPERFRKYEVLDPDDTMPAHLGRAGYRTQGIGKFHFIPAHERRLNGFHDVTFSEEMRWLRAAPTADDVGFDDYDQYLIERGLFGWEKPQEIGYNEIKPLINRMPREHHVTQWCGDRSVEWLEAYDGEEPFLLWSSFVKPHVPYDAPEHLADLYDPAAMPAPWRRDGELAGWPYYCDFIRAREFDLYSEHARNLALAYYYANITFIDEQVGRILAALERTGRIGNTIVVFTSDHGDLMGDHGLWYKSLGYEGSTHVPMMLWGPGLIEGGRRIDTPVSHYDIPITLMNLADAEYDTHERPGRDLCELADGGVARDAVVSHHTGYYLCHERWKYHFYPNGGHEELFDLHADPHELHNLAGQPGQADVQARLRGELVDWLRTYTGGAGTADAGTLAQHAYQPPVEATMPNPYSRMPWESRIPPAVLEAKGENVGWWWKKHGMDMTAMLHDKC